MNRGGATERGREGDREVEREGTQKTGIMCAEHIWLRAWAGCRRSCRFNADTMQRTAHGLLSATLCRPPPFSYVPSRHSLCLLHVLALARSLSSFALGRSIWFLEILWMPSMLITHQSHLPPLHPAHSFPFFYACYVFRTRYGHAKRMMMAIMKMAARDSERDLAQDADKTPAQKDFYWFPLKLVCVPAPKRGSREREGGG